MKEPNQDLECPACGCHELIRDEEPALSIHYLLGATDLLRECQNGLAVDIGPVLDAIDELVRKTGLATDIMNLSQLHGE